MSQLEAAVLFATLFPADCDPSAWIQVSCYGDNTQVDSSGGINLSAGTKEALQVWCISNIDHVLKLAPKNTGMWSEDDDMIDVEFCFAPTERYAVVRTRMASPNLHLP